MCYVNQNGWQKSQFQVCQTQQFWLQDMQQIISQITTAKYVTRHFLKLETLKYNKNKIVNTGEKNYNCKICDKSFTQTKSVKRHMLTHSGDKHYTCKICEKLFTQAGTLKTHMLVHTGGNSYNCKICYKSFSLKDTLITHMLNQTGKKAFGVCCTIIGKLAMSRKYKNIMFFISLYTK